MNKRIALGAAGLAAALALVAVGTAAGATMTAGPVDSSGVVHGCYGNEDATGTIHDFVLVDAGTACPANMTPIQWGQAGPQGSQGPQGDTGPQGPAGAPGANGNTVLSGTGAPAASLGQDGDFYLDTVADVLYGPKVSGAWPAGGTSLIGPAGQQGLQGQTGSQGEQGPAGPAGPAGPQGAPGTPLSSVTELSGITCTTTGGTAGTITVTTASNDTVTMTCTPTTTGCTGITHADGWGDTYTDCNALGTYRQSTADEAATAYVDGHNADLSVALQNSGPVSCGGAALDSWYVQADIPGSGTIYVTWTYLGPLAGRTAESTSAIPCPTSVDGFWN